MASCPVKPTPHESVQSLWEDAQGKEGHLEVGEMSLGDPLSELTLRSSTCLRPGESWAHFQLGLGN